uniref:Basic leucine zipper ATF-like transcription factor 2 n=1 Tax=Cynoglossus semilaevis TaxID=244447 RepID=A0A3P8WFW2_CYNSE
AYSIGPEPFTPFTKSFDGSHKVNRERMKRREKNRDAARKTRKKQTERADELHQELQRQERAKSALQKEITALKKEVQHYAKILQNHEPYCHLRASHSAFSSTASLPIKDQLKSIPSLFVSLHSW